jgi:Fe-S cluster assembly protein SufD
MANSPTLVRDGFLAEHAAFEAGRPSAEPMAVKQLRRTGLARFAEVGLPTPALEDWRFTDVSALGRTRYTRAAPAHNGVSADDVADQLIPGAAHLVFINGHSAPRLGTLPILPPGVIVTSLASALAEHPALVEAHLGRSAPLDASPFAALNTAYLADGAFIYIPRGVVVSTPIQLLFVGRTHGTPLVSYPRNLIVADSASRVTVVEQYVGLDADYFTCAVTELVTSDGAYVDHYKVQDEAPGASHMAVQALTQHRSSFFSSLAIHIGGKLVRNDVHAALVGEGADCHLNGLYMVHDRQLVDNHMWMEHIAPHCNSHELYKGILEDEARAVFNGRIKVHPGAQKTDAKQTNRNLLLSSTAVANSNPQLEIFADDVRCTHGSTVGQLDDDAVFYLRSRGIGQEAATSILTYAFAADIVERIRVPAVRQDIAEFLFRRLPDGDVVRDGTEISVG